MTIPTLEGACREVVEHWEGCPSMKVEPTETVGDRMKDLEPCNIPNCPWCGNKVETKPMRLSKEDAVHDVPKLKPSCGLPGCQVCEIPNRFDPYEALDTLDEITRDYEEDSPQAKSLLAALRAYITGMER